MKIMQRFEYRAVTKAEIDAAWEIANEVMERTGNWGGVESGITTLYAFVTTWGGYGLIEVEDASAMDEYVKFHNQNYGHVADIHFDILTQLN